MQTITEKLYQNAIPELKSKFGYTNQLAIPKLQMVSINVGIKAVDSDNKLLSYLLNQVLLVIYQHIWSQLFLLDHLQI